MRKRGGLAPLLYLLQIIFSGGYRSLQGIRKDKRSKGFESLSSFPIRDWNSVFSLALNTEALAPRKGVSPSKREIPRCCFLPQGRVYRKEVSASIQNGICRPDGQIFALRQQRFPPFMGGSKTGPPPFREGFNRPAGGERGGSNAASFMSGPESFPSRAVASVNPSAGHAATLSHRSRVSPNH